jgi:LysR family glycine cleavage system transcriptional activator
MRQLPPLNALHAFEVAARHLSFQRAAEELDVTPTAISHQVRALEDYLGIPLFRRRPRPLALTETGQFLYPLMRDQFDAIAEAIGRLQQKSRSTELTVSVINVFAAKWLVPRLAEFQRTHPEIDLRLQTSNEVVNLQTRTVDLAIRYGKGTYPGLMVYKLMSDVFIPVCSPQLLKGNHPLKEPGDLIHHPLLHFEWMNYGTEAPNWKNWLDLANVKQVNPTRGARFNDESLAIQAAIAGQGVSLCSSIHVADDVAMGCLVKPFEISLDGFHYSAVYLQNHPKEHLILEFIDWLVQQALLTQQIT